MCPQKARVPPTNKLQNIAPPAPPRRTSYARADRLRTSCVEMGGELFRLAGDTPQKALEISLPKKSGDSDIWIVPSVNDQIVLQSCVSAIAEIIEKRCLDPDIVFSCRLNTDPKHLAFLSNQVNAWKNFQSQTQERCALNHCVLQVDIKSAYESVNFEAFSKFIYASTDSHPAAKILVSLLKAFSETTKGIPFINDSVFFLGNAYFSEVDKILRSHNCKFIRFVDDYRIFGPSTAELEAILSVLRVDLHKMGFDINDKKLKLGTGEDYLNAMAKLKYEVIPRSQYAHTSANITSLDVSGIFENIFACLKNPDEKLHRGFGRMFMGLLSSMRVHASFSRARGDTNLQPEGEFSDLLVQSPEALELIVERLEEYRTGPQNDWKLIWVLYLCKSIPEESKKKSELISKIFDLIDEIQQSPALDPVARLWAIRTTADRTPEEALRLVEYVHGLEYLEAGRAWHGL